MLLARIGRFVATVARHGVPLGGIFGGNWHPVTAVGVYWLESALLVLATASLCALTERRTSQTAIDAARGEGDSVTVLALEMLREEVRKAGIHPRDVLLFHLGSLLVFGAFFAALIMVMVGNGRLDEPIRWRELAQGAEAMLLVVAIGWTIDLWTFNRFTVANVQARVDACLTRWALFWLLGFFGTMMVLFSGRTTVFFGLFAGLKVTVESWAGLARFFGWRSLKDRAVSGNT